METRREDVPNWKLLSNYINFMVAVEIEFGVKFKVADIELFENIGAIVAETKGDFGGEFALSRASPPAFRIFSMRIG